MKKMSLRWLALIVSVALAVVGASAAVAAHGTHNGIHSQPKKDHVAQAAARAKAREAFLADVAKRLGVSVDQLKAALKGAAEDRVDQAVKDGKIGKEQGDALKKAIESGQGPLGGRPGPMGHGPRGFHPDNQRGRGVGPLVPLMKAAAGYLGLKPGELMHQLRAGKSLADIAKAQGKSLDGLKQAVQDALKTRLDRAVKDGRLTAAAEQKMLAGFAAHLDQLLAGSLHHPSHPRHPMHPMGPGAQGPHDGLPPTTSQSSYHG